MSSIIWAIVGGGVALLILRLSLKKYIDQRYHKLAWVTFARAILFFLWFAFVMWNSDNEYYYGLVLYVVVVTIFLVGIFVLSRFEKKLKQDNK